MHEFLSPGQLEMAGGGYTHVAPGLAQDALILKQGEIQTELQSWPVQQSAMILNGILGCQKSGFGAGIDWCLVGHNIKESTISFYRILVLRT